MRFLILFLLLFFPFEKVAAEPDSFRQPLPPESSLPSKPAPPSEANEPVLKVGLIIPLSGPLAEYGLAIRNGFEMAASEHPDRSKKILLKIEDSKYDTKTSVGNFSKLHEIDQVNLVFVFGGPMSEALAPVADAKKLPTLLSTNDSSVVKNRAYSIRFSNPANDYGTLLSKWLLERKAKRVGLVKTDNQYLNAMFSGLSKCLSPEIELELIDSYRAEDQDFRSSVTKLKRKPFDALGVYLLSGQISSFLKMAKQQQLSLPVFGTDFFESKSEIQMAEGLLEGAVFPNNGVSKAFHETYREKYGNDSQITWAGYGHDMYLLSLLLAKTSAKSRSGEELIAALKTLPSFLGVMGVCSYFTSPEGDSYFGFPVELKMIRGQEFVTLPSA